MEFTLNAVSGQIQVALSASVQGRDGVFWLYGGEKRHIGAVALRECGGAGLLYSSPVIGRTALSENWPGGWSGTAGWSTSWSAVGSTMTISTRSGSPRLWHSAVSSVSGSSVN